jgi:hypothetical protein
MFGLMVLWFSGQSGTVRAKEWKGIVPLKTSRLEVARLLGPPDEMGGYQVKGTYVRIIYTSSDCGGELTTCECLVGKDIVERVSVAIQSELKLMSLKLNLKNYVRERDSHLLVYETYSDLDEGIVYTVFTEDNTVTNITYFPSKRDCDEILRRGVK